MSLIYVLLLIEIVFLIMAWFITNGDLSSVSVMVTLVMIVSTLFNVYAIGLWDDSTFYFDTVIAVSLGFFAVLIAELLSITIFKNRRRRMAGTLSDIEEIQISSGKVIIVTAACIIFTVAYYINIRAIGIRAGLNVATAISMIKSNYQDTTMRLNVFVRQGYKFITAFAYIGLFIFMNNMIGTKKIKKNLIHLIPAMCLVVVCTLSGGRVDIIRLASAGFLFYMVFLKQKSGWSAKQQKRNNWRFVKVAVPVILVLAIGLTQLRTITKGDISSNQIGNIMDYIAYYIGGPLQVLNTKIHKGILHYRLDYFGELTFRGFWNFVSRYGFTQEYIPLNLSSYEYLMIHMGIGGNTDTFVGPPLFDFGYMGMFMILFIEAYIFSRFYYKRIFFTDSSYERNKRMILYGFCYFIISMSYYENCMYTILSFTGIMSMVFLVVGYWFYFKSKFVIGSRRI